MTSFRPANLVFAIMLPALLLAYSMARAEDVVSPAAIDKLTQKKPAAKKPAAKKAAAKPKPPAAPAAVEDKPLTAVEKVESLTNKQGQAPAPTQPRIAAPKPGGPEYNYILFESNPTNAEVVVDGFYMGNTPLELPIKDGPHDVKLSHPGFTGWNRKIMSFAGFRITAILEPAKQAEAPKPAP
jgi:hypothetical protein